MKKRYHARQADRFGSFLFIDLPVFRKLFFLAVLMLCFAKADAQVSFSAAVANALRNSPKVRAAQLDERKAEAALASTKDIFVPSVNLGGGVGDAYGITLSVPTIFTLNAQSLVFSFQQRSYVHAGHMEVKAAQFAVLDAEQEVLEDAVLNYLALDHAQDTIAALKEQYSYAVKLASIMQDRENEHMESKLEVKKARLGSLELELQELNAEDDLASQRDHLSELTGLPAAQLVAISQSIPDLPGAASLDNPDRAQGDSPGILSAEAAVQARNFRAQGDAQYTWKPIISFGGQYGRISPIENVSEFYNIHGNYNTVAVGLQIQLPVLDKVRKDIATQSALEAARARIDLTSLRRQEIETQQKLSRSAREAAVHMQIAELNYGIAQDELQSVLIQAHALNSARLITPKDEIGAQMEERRRFLELVDVRLDARKAAILYLRQTGRLQAWFKSVSNTP